MNTNKKIAENRQPKYSCEICHYYTNKINDYNKHLSTPKHQRLINPNEKTPKVAREYKCDCGNTYKHSSSLCKHKKTCTDVHSVDGENIEEPQKKSNKTLLTSICDKDIIIMLMKQNTDLIKELSEYKNLMMKFLENGTHNTTNSHNKTFNLQFFLNETCKDAMNIMDFVDSIKLQLSDLEKVGELGYVEGISNIITKNLKALDINQRPIHCTDQKRETLYIKDENKWEKENEEKKKLRKVIKKVADKNARLIFQFKEVHPDCGKAVSKFSDQYNKIIVEAMGGSGDNDLEKEDKIIKNISKNVIIDKEN